MQPLKAIRLHKILSKKMIEQIIAFPIDDDITFTFKSIGEIREGNENTGYRVALSADFPPMAVPLKLDITTGDKITYSIATS